jgi:hypothetical protein
MDDENIFFSIDEKDNHQDYNKENNEEENYLSELLNEINNYDLPTNFSNEELFEAMCYEYKINYTVKDLLLICDYYGISKEMKTNKYNKDVIINVLVDFENNQINKNIVLKRQSMWFYITQLKNDKFMKKYVLWN